MDPDEQLSKIRERIDGIDSQLLELISERARCAQEVAQVKLDASQSDEAPPVFYRPEREAQVLRAIQERNPGPLASEHIASVFREIMSSCLALEQPLSVAFLGPEGTYSQAAALKHFGQSAIPQGHASIHKVFRQGEERLCDYGVVPVENSTEGMVGQTLDCFLESPLQITGEIELPVVHHLLAGRGAAQSDIQLILGHEQALGQCRQWLDSHLPKFPVRLSPATARRRAGQALRRVWRGLPASWRGPASAGYPGERHTGQLHQHHTIFGAGQRDGATQWPRQNLAFGLCAEPARCVTRSVAALRGKRHQSDAHRFPAL